MSIRENIENIQARIAAAAQKSGRRAEDITLVAVTKTVEPARILEAVGCGIRGRAPSTSSAICRRTR